MAKPITDLDEDDRRESPGKGFQFRFMSRRIGENLPIVRDAIAKQN
jgi:hypothetical protein